VIFKILAAVILGFITHQSKSFIDRYIQTVVWNFLVRVALGDIAKLPTLIAIYHELQIGSELERLPVAYLINSGAFGAGVLLGYIADAIRGR